MSQTGKDFFQEEFSYITPGRSTVFRKGLHTKQEAGAKFLNHQQYNFTFIAPYYGSVLFQISPMALSSKSHVPLPQAPSTSRWFQQKRLIKLDHFP